MPVLSKRSWGEVSKRVKDLRPDLYEAMNGISKSIKAGAYVYEIELPYGFSLISGGTCSLFDREFISQCDITKAEAHFIDKYLDDFSNKHDHPLSIIETGIVEIFENNSVELFNVSPALNYYFPLNIIASGEFLGTFGAKEIICDTKTARQNYSYSAWCGNYCVYPLLPRAIRNGKDGYLGKMKPLFTSYQIPFTESQELFELFPKLLQKMYTHTSNKHVRLFIIPDIWYRDKTPYNMDLRELISKEAWVQIKKSILDGSKVLPLLKAMDSEISDRHKHIVAEMLVYLESALRGQSLVLKPVTQEHSSLYPIYSELKASLKDVYDPVLLYFDSLKEKDWGIFPLFTFPTLSQLPPIPVAKDLINALEKGITAHIGHELQKNAIKYENNGSDFVMQHFPGREKWIPSTKSIFTRAILKVQRGLPSNDQQESKQPGIA